jgi:hypothetical protein
VNRRARLPIDAWDERRQLHETACKIAVQNQATHSAGLRTLISYWWGSLHAADRAAQQLIAYASVKSSSRTE